MPLDLGLLQELLELLGRLIFSSAGVLVDQVADIDGLHGLGVKGDEERSNGKADNSDKDIGEGGVGHFTSVGLGILEDYVADKHGQGGDTHPDEH